MSGFLSNVDLKTLHRLSSFISPDLQERLQSLDNCRVDNRHGRKNTEIQSDGAADKGHQETKNLENQEESLIAVLYLMTAAAFLNMLSFESRLKSFQEGTHGRLPASEDLFARAGFFLVEEGPDDDHVKCYMCNLGLKDWCSEDDPWIEHARFSPLCFHIKVCRGLPFLQGVASRHSTADSPAVHFPRSYHLANHDGLLRRLLAMWQSNVGRAVECTGMAPADVMLQICRGWIRERRTYTTVELIEVLQKNWEKEMETLEENSQLAEKKEELYKLCLSFYNNMPHCQIQPGATAVSGIAEHNAQNYGNPDVKTSAAHPGFSGEKREKVEQETKICHKNDSRTIKTTDSKVRIISELQAANSKRTPKNEKLCWNCEKEELSVLCLPCAHLSLCIYCIKTKKTCGICNLPYSQYIRTYLT